MGHQNIQGGSLGKTREDNSLRIVHQNIEGSIGKELEIELYLESSNVDILCLTEHWRKDCEMMFNINNYQAVSNFSRKRHARGGSVIFVKNNLKVKERLDIVNMSIEFAVEFSCVELDRCIIISVYRRGKSHFSIFESVMEDVLNIVCKSEKYVVVCGDFNVNLFEETSMQAKFTRLFKSFNLNNIFLEATRTTDHSATCIDNIFCDCKFQDKAIINCLKSDHSGQIVTLLEVKIKKSNKSTFMSRPITTHKVESFRVALEHKLPKANLTENNPDKLYKEFFEIISTEFDKQFKQKKIINKENKATFSDWATEGIRKSRNTLYDLYEQKSYNRNAGFVDYVKKYSKTFKNVCKQAKRDFLNKKITNSDNKIKTVWNIINSETGKVKPRDNNIVLKVDDKLIQSSEEVAEVFESFFTNIPVTTTEKLDSSPDRAETFLKENVDECTNKFNFRHINSDTIIKTFKSLNLKKTKDLWGLSVKLVSSIIDILAPYLSYIFNECVDEGVFPDLMKYSKVIPLFKAGSKEDPSNFRPVSVLPVLSKIFEKIILNQMLSHFNFCKLFNNKQFGFTKGRSTTDAGISLVKHIYSAWEASQDALGVFCDLSKAFDCVDHETLLRKLRHYGVKNRALDLLRSYLNNRSQAVEINGFKSSGSLVKIGVPQGSILGPFLFIVYINDLPYLVEKITEIVLFADDTSLIFKVARQQINLDEANRALTKVLDWFTANNLLLNAKKTKCIKFSLPNVKQVDTNLILDGARLDLVKETVFLGITIDYRLQWGPHITKLAGKLSSAAYAVKKIRDLTDVATARIVYFSYFHSIMSYGILLWGRAADIETIFVLQKRAIRSIYGLKRRDSLRKFFKEIDILTVISQYIYEVIVYVHKNIDCFKKRSVCHKFNTRNKHKITCDVFRLVKVNKSFMGNAILFYNKIPDEILGLSFRKFKVYVKKILFSKAYYSVNDYLNDKKAWYLL